MYRFRSADKQYRVEITFARRTATHTTCFIALQKGEDTRRHPVCNSVVSVSLKDLLEETSDAKRAVKEVLSNQLPWTEWTKLKTRSKRAA